MKKKNPCKYMKKGNAKMQKTDCMQIIDDHRSKTRLEIQCCIEKNKNNQGTGRES